MIIGRHVELDLILCSPDTGAGFRTARPCQWVGAFGYGFCRCTGPERCHLIPPALPPAVPICVIGKCRVQDDAPRERPEYVRLGGEAAAGEERSPGQIAQPIDSKRKGDAERSGLGNRRDALDGLTQFFLFDAAAVR